MAITINGIVCEEYVNNYRETADLLRGPQARKGFICNWADRWTVAKGLLGLSHTTSIGGLITLQTPTPHPELSTTYAHTIEIEPKGSPTQGARQITWPKCIVWCNYETMPWNFQAYDNPFQQIDPTTPFIYAEQRLSSSCEFDTMPASGTFWQPTGTQCQQDSLIRLALVHMEITIKQLPYMPTYEVLTQAGTCNNAMYLGVAAGKLFFDGVTTQQGAVSDGTFIQEVTFRFTARTVRWDYRYRPDTGTYQQLLLNDGSPICASSDFSKIIPSYYHM